MYGQRFSGYFRAPETGEYKFYLSADQSAELWLGKTENNSSPENQEKIAEVLYHTGWRSYYETPAQSSRLINLTKGSFYPIEAFHAANWGNDHITVAVETPSDEWRPNSVVQQSVYIVRASFVNEQILIKLYNIVGGTFTFLMQTVDSEGF